MLVLVSHKLIVVLEIRQATAFIAKHIYEIESPGFLYSFPSSYLECELPLLFFIPSPVVRSFLVGFILIIFEKISKRSQQR